MEQISLRDYCEEARSLIQSGQPDKAIHFTRRILSHYPRHVESYRLLGQALLAKGNYPEAAKQFRRVLSVDPEDATSRAGLAEVHEAAGDPDKAIWYMQRAVELSPGDTGLRAQLGQLINARQGGDAPERIEITRVALGRIHTRSGLYAKAIQEYKAALTQDPDRMDVRAALAEALWRAGRYAEAARASQHVIEKLPN
ncbi:MAG: tetratricopeptide repeat protein, partial [Anaerolineales bacterium]